MGFVQERGTYMKKHYPIGLMIKKIHTAFETETNKELVKLNLTRSQVEILIFVRTQMMKNIEVNQIDIEKEFNLKNPTVTGILNRLEEKNYIKRIQSSKNARYKKIVITENVFTILEQASKHGRVMEEKLKKCLTKQEQEDLTNILDKIINYII